ncbi:MAG TPA: D-alanyl-D-alanine carboxypeptidase family protein [Mycobacteriales bacterium]|nr:D-alanyl-D-alanine carboxypeptidase family protein [Mycobacteriales bacterium]
MLSAPSRRALYRVATAGSLTAALLAPAVPALAQTPAAPAPAAPAAPAPVPPAPPRTPLEEAGASPTSTSPTPDPVEEARKVREQAEQQVAAFRQQVEQATAVLTEGSQRLAEKQAELARTQTEQTAAQRAAREAVAEADAARAALSRLAAASFRSPVPDAVQLALSTGPEGLRDAVVARADLDRVRGSSQDAVREAKAARVAADAALRTSAQLTEAAAEQQAAVEAEVHRLREFAQQSRATLEAASVALSAAQEVEQVAVADATARALAEANARKAMERARAAARANRAIFATCSATPSGPQANGFMDPSTLCPLDDAPGHALRPDAAAAFNAMNAAHKAERGGPLCVTDSYRSYAAQVDVYARKPDLAAVPGSSNHGLGMALDLCGGVERFGSEAHLWMKVNAVRFGWFHPAWAQQTGSKPEAWHWEFAGDDEADPAA